MLHICITIYSRFIWNHKDETSQHKSAKFSKTSNIVTIMLSFWCKVLALLLCTGLETSAAHPKLSNYDLGMMIEDLQVTDMFFCSSKVINGNSWHIKVGSKFDLARFDSLVWSKRIPKTNDSGLYSILRREELKKTTPNSARRILN